MKAMLKKGLLRLKNDERNGGTSGSSGSRHDNRSNTPSETASFDYIPFHFVQTVIFNSSLHSSVSEPMSSHHLRRPSPQEILRYRYQHGTNLGSIFVCERWLHGSMFDHGAAGESELDAVVASITIRGLDETRAKWEAHWASALSDEDLQWLSETAHCTVIRLPIGYFTLGPTFCEHTPFSMQPAQVYVNAWAAVKKLVARCYTHGIGVLIDMHGLPGGANTEAHSGTSTGKAELWNNRFNLDLAIKCLCNIAEEARQMPGVIGLQPCNEAQWNPPGLYDFYDNAIETISDINADLPIYISDGWDLQRALNYSLSKNSVKGKIGNPVVVDTHKYYTFAEKDTSRSPQELIEQAKTELSELCELNCNVFDHKGAIAVFVGEYSCALAPQTWNRAFESDQPSLLREFGHAQTDQWASHASGSAFWTLKMDNMPGNEWGFKAMSAKGAIITPFSLSFPGQAIAERCAAAEGRRAHKMVEAMQVQTSFWDKQAPGGVFEHWRYADGWHLGWSDARDFFRARIDGVLLPSNGDDVDASVAQARFDGSCASKRARAGAEARDALRNGGDKIGALDLWILKRMREERCADRETCAFGWEWEHGFRKGVKDFYGEIGL